MMKCIYTSCVLLHTNCVVVNVHFCNMLCNMVLIAVCCVMYDFIKGVHFYRVSWDQC